MPVDSGFINVLGAYEGSSFGGRGQPVPLPVAVYHRERGLVTRAASDGTPLPVPPASYYVEVPLPDGRFYRTGVDVEAGQFCQLAVDVHPSTGDDTSWEESAVDGYIDLDEWSVGFLRITAGGEVQGFDGGAVRQLHRRPGGGIDLHIEILNLVIHTNVFIRLPIRGGNPVYVALPIPQTQPHQVTLSMTPGYALPRVRVFWRDPRLDLALRFIARSRLDDVHTLLSSTSAMDGWEAAGSSPLEACALASLWMRLGDLGRAREWLSRAEGTATEALVDARILWHELAYRQGVPLNELAPSVIDTLNSDLPVLSDCFALLVAQLLVVHSEVPEIPERARAIEGIARLERWLPFVESGASTLTFVGSEVLSAVEVHRVSRALEPVG